jgi:hypothetical protein
MESPLPSGDGLSEGSPKSRQRTKSLTRPAISDSRPGPRPVLVYVGEMRRIARRMIRHRHGRCPKCDYDLRRAGNERCPECGAVV